MRSCSIHDVWCVDFDLRRAKKALRWKEGGKQKAEGVPNLGIVFR